MISPEEGSGWRPKRGPFFFSKSMKIGKVLVNDADIIYVQPLSKIFVLQLVSISWPPV